MRKPFKLKSGNAMGASSFKSMGATPATPGESPAKLMGLLKWGWRAMTKSKKVKNAVTATTKKTDDMFNKKTRKMKDAYNKTDVDNVIQESAENAIAKKSLEYGGKTQAAKDLITIGTIGGVGAGYKYMTRTDPDGSSVQAGPMGDKEDEVIPYSKDSGKTNKANAVKDKRKNLLD